ncbi:MAG: lmo0937 family membrane protein [Deinococcales bacterium]
MLVGIAVVLVILWILGLVTSTTLGGAIHVLVIVAVVLLVVRVFQGMRA